MYMKKKNRTWRMCMCSKWIAYTLFSTAVIYRSCGTRISIRISNTERILNWRGAGLIRTVAIVDANVVDDVVGEKVLRGMIGYLHYFIVIKQLRLLHEQPINHLRCDADKHSISWVYRPEITLLIRAEVLIKTLCKKRICFVWKRCIPHNSRLVIISI